MHAQFILILKLYYLLINNCAQFPYFAENTQSTYILIQYNTIYYNIGIIKYTLQIMN